MAKKTKRRRLVPRLGPPVNVRPGGAHGDLRHKPRGEAKRAAIREEAALEF
jgi:hypothetical protein